LIVDHIDEVIFTVERRDNGAAIGFVNGRVTELLGYTPDEVIRLGDTLVHAADIDGVRQHAREMFAGAATSAVRYRVRARNGEVRWFEHRLHRMPSSETTLLGVARDVTDRVDGARERPDGDEGRQTHKMEALGRLAGGIAHDFNNLLTTIGGNASFVLELLPPDDSPTREALDDILAACDRAARFTRQLLAFSRKQVLKPEPLRIGDVVSDMQHMLSRLLGPEYGLQVRFEPHLPPVACDRSQMEQVVMNLVVNARDAMPGGGPIFVTGRLANDADQLALARMPSSSARTVVLEVADRGGGVPDDIRERIFEPFFTTKERGKGTGLGLAMVYGFVHQSGGHVELVSSRESGTTFLIYLPAIAATEPAGVAPSPSPDRHRAKDMTVLVVDDEAGVRHLASAMLRRSGYKVLEASDGMEAERVASEHKGGIHVLLTDIVMPAMRGPELAARLRGARPLIRVVYMSGFRDTEPLADVECGEAVFLPKPFLRAELLEAINRVGTSA
jgi:PAS domain S-box-containing protein